jgi:hypothetical protein
LFSSAGLVLFQIDLGTTPNMAPPSNLKLPVLSGLIFIEEQKRVYRLISNLINFFGVIDVKLR